MGHPNAFAAWVHDGDAAPLVDLYGGPPFDDNGLAVYLGGSCTDAKWPTNWNTWRRDNWNYFAKAPFVTWVPGNRSDVQCDPVPAPQPLAALSPAAKAAGSLAAQRQALTRLLDPRQG